MKVELFKGCSPICTAVLPGIPAVGTKIGVYCRPSCETKTYTVQTVSFLYDQYEPDTPARVFVHVTQDVTH